MRLFVLVVVVGLLGCGAPCSSSTSEQAASSSSFACVAEDGGARVVPRVYSALQVNTATACTGALDGGQLVFSVTIRSCEASVSEAPALVACSLPSLPAGRYAVGERTLSVPGDGGVTTCE